MQSAAIARAAVAAGLAVTVVDDSRKAALNKSEVYEAEA